MLVEGVNLLETYKTLESQADPFGKEENKILLPVNINLLRFNDGYFSTTSSLYNYKYKDEYIFNDKLLIYDLKTGFNKRNKHLLDDLKRTQNITYYKKQKDRETTTYNDSQYLRKTKDHIDWTENGYGLRLSRILKLKPSHSEAFKPADKYIYLDYNHLYDENLHMYSLYLIPNRELKNFHSQIKYGKLKEKTKESHEIFDEKPQNNITWCVIKNRVLSEKQINRIRNMEEGYEGRCDKITLSHGDINKNSPVKWSTPYVFFDFKMTNDSYWREYYQYMMGDYSDKKGISENLLGSENKKIWGIDYDNIFQIENKENHLLINLNKEALPKDHQNFLRISKFFNFEFSYSEKDESKKITFDMKKILEGEAKIFFEANGSMFSNFSLTIKLKEDKRNNEIEIMDDLEERVYKVKIDHLKETNLMLDHILVDWDEIKKRMPSQFWNEEELTNLFHFASSNRARKVKFTESLVRKMKVKSEYSDSEGILKIKFRDLLTNAEREAVWGGMKKIPTKHKLIATAENAEEAKAKLKEMEEFMDLPQYFWDSIDFSPVPKNDFWSPFHEYKIIYSGPNAAVKDEWERLIKSKINIFNELNFHTNSLILTEEMAKNSAASWFKSRDIDGNDKPLSKDLIFTKTEEDGRNIRVTVSVNNGTISSKRDFVFQVMKKQKEEAKIIPASVVQEKEGEESLNFLTENAQKIMMGVGCAVGGGGITCLLAKAPGFFKRKF